MKSPYWINDSGVQIRETFRDSGVPPERYIRIDLYPLFQGLQLEECWLGKTSYKTYLKRKVHAEERKSA